MKQNDDKNTCFIVVWNVTLLHYVQAHRLYIDIEIYIRKRERETERDGGGRRERVCQRETEADTHR